MIRYEIENDTAKRPAKSREKKGDLLRIALEPDCRVLDCKRSESHVHLWSAGDVSTCPSDGQTCANDERTRLYKFHVPCL